MSEPFRIVVPARYGSSRLPAKALREVAGLPLVIHAWRRAMDAGALEVIVATDDERIVEVVRREGGFAMMTSSEHPSGTDRLAEVAARRGWDDEAIVVNLQGDEPLVPPALLVQLVHALASSRRARIATLATPIRDSASLFAPNIVKVVVDRTGHAHTFSRAPIPYARDAFANDRNTLPAGIPFLRHLGLYAYRAGALRELAAAPQGIHERVECLEQLRAIELGIPIHVSIVAEAPPHGVDAEEDIERVRALLEA